MKFIYLAKAFFLCFLKLSGIPLWFFIPLDLIICSDHLLLVFRGFLFCQPLFCERVALFILKVLVCCDTYYNSHPPARTANRHLIVESGRSGSRLSHHAAAFPVTTAFSAGARLAWRLSPTRQSQSWILKPRVIYWPVSFAVIIGSFVRFDLWYLLTFYRELYL